MDPKGRSEGQGTAVGLAWCFLLLKAIALTLYACGQRSVLKTHLVSFLFYLFFGSPHLFWWQTNLLIHCQKHSSIMVEGSQVFFLEVSKYPSWKMIWFNKGLSHKQLTCNRPHQLLRLNCLQMRLSKIQVNGRFNGLPSRT